MCELQIVNPYCTCPVLKGIAGRYAEIELQLFPESAKDVELFLLDGNIAYTTHERRRFSGDRAHAVSVLSLLWRAGPRHRPRVDPSVPAGSLHTRRCRTPSWR